MKKTVVGIVSVLCLCAAAAIVRASGNSQVVTNPTPALSAAMTLVSADPAAGMYNWNVNGKIKPAYRGFGADVKLVCQQYARLGLDVPLVFPNCAGEFCGQTNVDSCGNFSFPATLVSLPPGAPQLDNSYVCNFVVHVNGASAPQACSNRSAPPDAFPEDPNGSAPCAGGLCPNVP